MDSGIYPADKGVGNYAFNTLNRTALSEDGPRIEDIKVILSELSFSCVPEGDRCFDFNGKYVCE